MPTPVPVRYFACTDKDAPQIVGSNPQTWLHVLRQCLVGNNGIAYGNKPSAGWTCPYEDRKNLKLVVRQGGGHQRYLRVANPIVLNSTGGTTGTWFLMSMRGYNAMTSVDAGTGLFPDASFTFPNWGMSSVQPGANNTQNQVYYWYMAADDRFVYFKVAVGVNSSNGSAFCPQTIMFGDTVGAAANDTTNTILTAFTQVGSATENNWMGQGRNSAGSLIQQSDMIYNYGYFDGPQTQTLWSAGSILPETTPPGGQNVYTAWNTALVGSNSNGTGAYDASTYNKKLGLVPVGVFESGTAFRGFLPGLYLHDSNLFATTANIISDQTVITTVGGPLNRVPLRYWNNSQNTGNVVSKFIRMDTWRSV